LSVYPSGNDCRPNVWDASYLAMPTTTALVRANSEAPKQHSQSHSDADCTGWVLINVVEYFPWSSSLLLFPCMDL